MKAERLRVDHQIGEAGGAGGLATRSGLGDLIDFAVESGAITRSFEQNVMTLRANAAGLARFLTNQPVSPGIPSPFWNGLEFSASFDTGKGTTKEIRGIPQNASQEVIFSPTGAGGRFTSRAIRWSSEPRNARSAVTLTQWSNLVRDVTTEVAERFRATNRSLDEAFVRETEEALLRTAANAPRHFYSKPGWGFAFEGRVAAPTLQPKTYSGKIVASWAPVPCSNCGIGAFTLNAAWT